MQSSPASENACRLLRKHCPIIHLSQLGRCGLESPHSRGGEPQQYVGDSTVLRLPVHHHNCGGLSTFTVRYATLRKRS